MHRVRLIATALLMAGVAGTHAGDDLVVYPPVPGLAASEHYTIRVRPAGGGDWQPVFAWQTSCKPIAPKTDGYFDTLAGWSHTYCNFETAGAVEVEIARVDGRPIRTAVVHPRRKASACAVVDGTACVTLDHPCLVAVDIDGQMDDQDTGKGYRGPPLHTVSVFANPPLADKPNPNDPGVLVVRPGEAPPADGDWTTLVFMPGVHDVGLAFPLRAGCRYYIPGDALVYGTLSSHDWAHGRQIHIFGHGTLSGARLKHPGFVEPALAESDRRRYRPIEILGATDVHVEGITITDSATHSLMLIGPYQPGHPNQVTWTKIVTWRVNGDGINPFGNTLVEDCFLRTQDDSLYVSGLGIRRTVLWNDANGSSFVLSALPQLADRQLVVEDCDVIYSRAKWHHWTGGRVFNMRGEGGGAAGAGVVFRNITVEDPRPTLQQFFLCMTVPQPYSREGEMRTAGDLAGVRFQNIAIAAPSVLGEPQLLWGHPQARIHDLTFDNLSLAGEPVRGPGFFRVNEAVGRLIFTPSAGTLPDVSRRQDP